MTLGKFDPKIGKLVLDKSNAMWYNVTVGNKEASRKMEAKQILVQRLKERQGSRSQTEYAEFLGISRAMLSRLYSQDRQIGVDTLTRVCEKYPDLAYLFLSESVSTIHTGAVQREEIPQAESSQAPPAAP